MQSELLNGTLVGCDTGVELAQGDLLSDCVVPELPSDFVPPPAGSAELSYSFIGRIVTLIIVTQSCDFDQGKVDFVALCPSFTLQEFAAANPVYARRGAWETVRQGRQHALHPLAPAHGWEQPPQYRVVDFRMIHSLPLGYLQRHAGQLGTRLRLRSPYLEHFSQAFARFFMRVGLPSDIPPFK